MIKYKIDVMDELKKIGFNSMTAKQTKTFSQSTMTKFSKGDANISIDNLNRLCTLLHKKPDEIIDYTFSDNDTEYTIETITSKKD